MTKPTPKASTASTLRQRAAQARDDAGRFIRPAPARDDARQDTVPAPVDAPAGTYALRVDEGGLGLHAAPGASIIVAPVMPTGAGLAVLYPKGVARRYVFDLPHSFRPELTQPFAPGSEVAPMIEVVDPGTGRARLLPADRVEKIHKVIGVYTPVEIASAHRRAPPPLPVMQVCPEGMGEHRVGTAAAYPLVRAGETVVYDPSRRDPTAGALCVLHLRMKDSLS